MAVLVGSWCRTSRTPDEGSEGVATVAILEERVLYRGSMDRTQESGAEYTSNAHHVEWIERPVMEALEEENEAEDRRHAKRRREEPSALSEWVDDEDRDEDSDRSRERQGVVWT